MRYIMKGQLFLQVRLFIFHFRSIIQLMLKLCDGPAHYGLYLSLQQILNERLIAVVVIYMKPALRTNTNNFNHLKIFSGNQAMLKLSVSIRFFFFKAYFFHTSR